MISRLQPFAKKHTPTAKGSETHWIADDRIGGVFNVSGHEGEFVDKLASDVAGSKASRQRLSVYEKLHPTFRFFLTLVTDDVREEFLKRIFRIIGTALRDESRGENVFFPQLELSELSCLVLHDGSRLRFVLPEVIVDSTRALQLHRHIMERLNTHLAPDEKQRLLSGVVCTTKAYAILPLDAWKTVLPNEEYKDDLGVAMYGSVAAMPCPAVVERKGRGSHRNCDHCEQSGYVSVRGRIGLLSVLRNAADPAVDLEEARRLQGDEAAAIVATTLRAAAVGSGALTEPFLVPSYASIVPMHVNRSGRQEASDLFDCERSAFGPPSKTSNRYEYSAMSNNMDNIRAMALTQTVCRKMHKTAYSRVVIKKMYKVTHGMRTVVRVQADGQNATFCMKVQRQHTGRNACRASFTIESIRGEPKIYQECFSPECQGCGKKRYCSDPKPIPQQLATLLGFSCSSSDDGKLQACAVELFRQMRS